MGRPRAQGATEYLVILGAVLLVALVVIALLGWFPSLGGATREQQSRSYWAGAAPFGILAQRFDNGSAMLTIENHGSDRLNLSLIQFDDGAGTIYNLTFTPTVFVSGESKVIYNSSFTGGNPCVVLKPGSQFEYAQVIFTYMQGAYQMRQYGAKPLAARCA